MSECIFKKVGACRGTLSDKLSECGSARINTIIEYSKSYEDGLCKLLDEILDANENSTVPAHRNCVSTYCSRVHLKRHLGKKNPDTVCTVPSPAKQRRRSSTPDFDFKTKCIFCGTKCECNPDPKNPSRWRPAYQVRTLYSKGFDLKGEVLRICAKRGDKLAAEVRLIVEGAPSDLHAADARYHVDCKAKFMTPDHVKRAAQANASTSSQDIDLDFEYIVNIMLNDKASLWNSVELYNHYNGLLSRRSLMLKLGEHFGDELLVLSSPGVAIIVVFRSHAPELLKLIPDNESAIDSSIETLAKAVCCDIKSINLSKKHYNTRLTGKLIQESVSETLLSFLSRLSNKLDHSPQAYLIGSIVTSFVTNIPTMLQTTLAVLMRNSKKLVNIMNSMCVTCTYDELLKFKKSAAFAATLSTTDQGISDSSKGMIQTVADNFDADISSQNGKLSTHSLAVLQTQKDTGESPSDTHVIKRLNQSEMNQPIDYEFQVQRYHGPKKPPMPKEKTKSQYLL